jgi:RND family efflux transporter MFP subunit
MDAARAAHDSARAASAGAQAQLRLANLALADVELKVPQTAVVLERRVERGTLVTAGTPGFVLGTVNPVKAVFGVPDQTVQRMTPGSTLTLTTDAIGGRTFTGRITTVSPAADPQTRLFMVEVSIPNNDAALRPGMVATVELDAPVQTAPDAPLVPLTAVVKRDGSDAGYAVFVFERHSDRSGVARSRAVTLGNLVGNAIQVTSGIRVADTVIVSAPTLLADGDTVTLVP